MEDFFFTQMQRYNKKLKKLLEFEYLSKVACEKQVAECTIQLHETDEDRKINSLNLEYYSRIILKKMKRREGIRRRIE